MIVSKGLAFSKELSVGVVDFSCRPVALYLSRKDSSLADSETFLHAAFAVVKPLKDDLPGSITYDSFEELAPRTRSCGFSTGQNLPGKDFMYPFTQVSYLSELSTIFVTVRQDVEEVFYSVDIQLGEFFSDTRTNPFKMHNGGG